MKWTNIGRWPGLPEERFWTPSKLLSGSIALVCVALGVLLDSPATGFEVGVGAAFPLMCIWVPEIMGAYGGSGVLLGRPITRPSPSGLVYVLGWLLLLLPIAQVVTIAWSL